MTIRSKLLLSYTLLLIISLLLFVLAAFVMTVAFTGDISNIRSFYTSHYAVKPLTATEEAVYLDAKFLVKTSPDQLLDVSVLEQLNSKLAEVDAGLVMRKGGEVIYASSWLSELLIAGSLPALEPANIKVRDTLQAGDRFYTYAKFDFTFPDKEDGGYSIVKEVSPYAELTRKLLPLLIGVLLLLLIAANGLLNYWVTRTIARPLTKLRQAADQIKDGDLNFQVAAETDDEIGQLSRAFEQMRHKLKESVDSQLQYEENRKELLSNISHDLRTPMTAIIGYVQGIREGIADTPGKLEKYLHTIYCKAKDMDRLIEDLFLFSKLDLKRVPFAFERLEVSGLIQHYLEELRLDLEQEGVQLRIRMDAQEGIMVLCDRVQLKRVFANIIQNSVRFMNKPEKWLEVELRPDSQAAIVKITDNGAGIPSESVPFIFDRFYKSDPSRGTSASGSGLGLAIAKQIIARHHGKIWAESQLGEGTAIYFSLPLAEQEGATHV